MTSRVVRGRSGYVFIYAVLIFAAAVLAWGAAYAVHVSPPAVYIESNDRTAQVTINNRGKIPKVFRFSWQHRVMTPNGEVKLIKDDAELANYPDYRPVEQYLRYSPRQTVLQPGQYQKINFLVRRTKDMPEGEFHSHFLIEEEPILQAKGPKVEGEAIGGQLMVRVNKAIPIFLRNGETKLDIDIAEARVTKKDGQDALALKLRNNSTRSVYAPVRLTCTTPAGETIVRTPKRLRLYYEAGEYNDTIAVRDMPFDQCKSLKVELTGWRDFEYNDRVIASRQIR